MSDYAEINQKLKNSGVVLLPTETVYGLACTASDSQAIEKIYAIKGRAFQKPLAVCVKDLETARRFGYFSAKAIDLAKRYWPGSLTLIVEAKPDIDIDTKCLSHSGKTSTIAFRCPDASWLNEINGPLALTSANRSSETDCVSYEAAVTEFGEEIDGGLFAQAPLSGLPSTIISVLNGEVKTLRQGLLEVSL